MDLSGILTMLGWLFLLAVPTPGRAQTQATETITNIASAQGTTESGERLQDIGSATTSVPLVSHLTLDIHSDSTTAQPGEQRTFRHVLTNRGNFAEWVQLDLSDQLGWPVQLLTTSSSARPSGATLASGVSVRRSTRVTQTPASHSPQALDAFPSLMAGPLAPGDSLEIQVNVSVPATATLGEINDMTLVVQSLRVPSEVTTARDRVLVADPRMDPLWLEVQPAGPARPGEVLQVRLEFGNPDPAVALRNVQWRDVLDASLEFVDATQGVIDDEAVPGRQVPVLVNWNSSTRELVWSTVSLPPGFRGTLQVQARIAAGTADGTRIAHEIAVVGDNITSATSNRVETVVLSQILQLTVTSAVQDILPGDPLLYEVTLANLSSAVAVQSAALSFTLPAGFRFLDQGSSAQGKPMATAPSESRVAQLPPVTLAAGKTFSWMLAAATSERIDKGTHLAQASVVGEVLDDIAVGASSDAVVRVLRRLDEDGIILGRVYIDEDENQLAGMQEGLPNVRILLEDGTQVWTDARGRYHLDGIRPGVRVVRLDTSDLPSMLTFDSEGRLAAGNDRSRFVDVQPGEVRSVDFRAVRQRNAPVRKYEIALGGEAWEFYDFSLFAPGQVDLRPEAARMLSQLAAGVSTTAADSLRLRHGEPWARQRWAMGMPAPMRPVDVEVTPHALDTERSAPNRTVVESEDTAAPVPRIPSADSGHAAEEANLAEARRNTLRVALTGQQTPEDTAPDVPEVSLEDIARAAQPGVAILEPQDGALARGDRTRVAIQMPQGDTARLLVNGHPVGAELVGRHVTSPGNGVVVQEYVGVPLVEGRNTITLEVCGPDSVCVTQRVRVLLPGEPQRLVVHNEASPADGRTEPLVILKLLDAWEKPVSHVRLVTLEVEGGILGADADPRRPGHQVRLRNGTARVLLPPATRAEERNLRVHFGNLEEHHIVRLVPAPADWMITGVGEVTLAARPSDQPLTVDEAQRGIDGRAGIFARGRIGAQSELTLGLETERQEEELFAERERQRLAPVVGDESVQGSAAASRWPLFARVDVPEGHAQIGDFHAGWNNVELARLDRSLTGFDGTWTPEEGNASVQGFVASARQRARLDQFPAVGTSGPFTLLHRPMLVHSERVSIETRHRIHSERIVTMRPLVRDLDYTVDYVSGTILLKEALPGTDVDFNPNTLVVHYESIDEGEERPVFGMHGTVQLGRGVDAGLTVVSEQTAWGSQVLLGTHGGWSPRADMRFDYEFARSMGLQDDDAFRIAWRGRAGPTQETRAYYRQIGANFRNDSRTGRRELGTRKYGLEAAMRAGLHGHVDLQSWMQEDLIGQRQTWSVASDYRQDRRSGQWSLGHRLVGRSDTEQHLVSNVLALGVQRRLGSRLGIEIGAQKAIGDAIETHPSRLHLGADARLTSRLIVTGRQEWDGSDMGRSATLLGLESALGSHTSLTSRVENVRGPFDDRVAAWAGIRTRVPLSSTWSANGSAEQGRLFTAERQRNTALSTGVQWQDASRLWSLQLETRSIAGSREHAVRTSASVRFGQAWTLLAREHWRRIIGVPGSRDTHDAMVAWAYRPVHEGAMSWLGSVRAVIDPNPWLTPGVSLSRTVASLEGTWRLSRHYSWVGGVTHRFAATSAQATSIAAQTWLTHGRLIYDIGGGFDLSVGLRHRWRNQSASDWSWGGELGYLLLRDVWVVAGYNVVGFADIDLPTSVHAGQAGYLSFRFKFDERLLLDQP